MQERMQKVQTLLNDVAQSSLVPRLPQAFNHSFGSEAAIKSLGRPGDEASSKIIYSSIIQHSGNRDLAAIFLLI